MNSGDPRFQMNHRDRFYTSVYKYEAKTEKAHWHDNYVIEIVTSGEGVHKLNRETFPYTRGSAYAMRLRDYHEVTITKPTTVHRIELPVKCMPERFVRSMLTHRGNLTIVMNEELTTHLENLLLLLESRPERTDNFDELFVQDCLLNVIIMLFTREVNATLVRLGEVRPDKVDDVLLYVEDNFRKKLSVPMVAAHFNMSPDYINRLFRENIGFPIYHVIKILRLRYAAQLCRETTLSFKKICEICCYSGTANFQRDFRKEYGLTPKLYRQAAKAGKFAHITMPPIFEMLSSDPTSLNSFEEPPQEDEAAEQE